MFSHDAVVAAKTQQVFSLMDSQIDEWRRRFSKSDGFGGVAAQRRWTAQPAERTTSAAHGSSLDAGSPASLGLEQRVEKIERMIVSDDDRARNTQEEVRALSRLLSTATEQNLKLRSEIDSLRADLAQRTAESREVQRRMDALERTMSSVLLTANRVSSQADRQVTMSVSELVSLAQQRHDTHPLTAGLSRDHGGVTVDSIATLQDALQRIRFLEDQSAETARRFDRVAETVVARTVDRLREELLLAERRPVDLIERTSALVVNDLHTFDLTATTVIHGDKQRTAALSTLDSASGRPAAGAVVQSEPMQLRLTERMFELQQETQRRLEESAAVAERKRREDEIAAATQKRKDEEAAAAVAERKRREDEIAAATQKRKDEEAATAAAAVERQRDADAGQATESPQSSLGGQRSSPRAVGGNDGVPFHEFDGVDESVGGVDAHDFDEVAVTLSGSRRAVDGSDNSNVKSYSLANEHARPRAVTQGRGLMALLGKQASDFDDDDDDELPLPVAASTSSHGAKLVRNPQTQSGVAAAELLPSRHTTNAAATTLDDDFDF